MNITIDWSNLEDVGGSAKHIPELLAELEATGDDEILNELWERLYHQGSVFSASFAALPDLIRIAGQRKPGERINILSLALEILSGEDIANLRRPSEQPIEWTTTSDRIDLDSPKRDNYQNEIDALLPLLEEDLEDPDLFWDGNFVRLIAGILTLKGYSGWKEPLESPPMEFYGYGGYCESCDAWIEVEGNEEADTFMAKVETEDNRNKTTIIQPAMADSLTGHARWIYETALNRPKFQFDSVAKNITYIQGSGTCPQCGKKFSVPELLNFDIQN